MMIKHAILCHPQTMQVYKEDAVRILLCEVRSVFSGLNIEAYDIAIESIAGITYIVFCHNNTLDEKVLTAISRLSSFFALYKIKDDVLLPIASNPHYQFDQNMAAILKYQGKTNERFTRLMVNLAVSVCKTKSDIKPLRLLDPVSGKGTTLYDAMMLGCDVYGIEIRNKYFMESATYVTKFMQQAKIKHKTRKGKISDKKARKIADTFSLEYGKDKDRFYAGEVSIIKLFAGDTMHADRFIKKKSIDIIVGDLPYGIQHASKGRAPKSESSSRSAEKLFADALPRWNILLKAGGALVMSF